MSKFIPLFLISLAITVQGLYMPAFADSEMVALVPSAAKQINDCQDMMQKESDMVAAQNQFVPGVTIYTVNIGSDEANRLAHDGVFVGSKTGNRFLELEGGNILVNPENDIIVGTHAGNIYVGTGAAVFIVDSGDDTVVYDLLQTKPKQVSVIVNKHRMVMEPGRMIVLTKQDNTDFEKLAVDCHRVVYHNAQMVEKNLPVQAVKTFAADFSIASAMVNIEPLKKMTVSRNEEDKLVTEKLVKGAVLLGDFAAGLSEPMPAAQQDDAIMTVKADGPLKVAADYNQISAKKDDQPN